MLKLDNKPLSYDRAFTHNGIQYPANWLRLSSLDERNALGITEVSNDPTYDQRFYWNVSTPKQLDDKTETVDGVEVKTTGLKTLWSNTQDQIASSLLSPSDWVIIKAKETGTHIPATWKTYRAAVRTACNTRQTEINAVADVPALIELLFGAATVTQQKKDSEGVGMVEPDTITNEAGETVANPVAGQQVMETVTNPAIATAWPTPI
jgi:hypothetical protein